MFGLILLAIVGMLGFLLVRAGAKPGTVFFILVGIFVPLSIALAAWFLAAPPIWTLFAQRAEALVQVADIVEPRDGPPRGYQRSDVVDVRVRLEQERSGRLLALYGVEPPEGAFTTRLEAQNALREAYPIGRSFTVRVSRDVAYVDRQDWFSTILFVFCVVFALLMSVIAIIVVGARAGSRTQPPSS
ncbi:MAG: hypothetical protein AAF234_04390 [Pseudomonadota bacterium]